MRFKLPGRWRAQASPLYACTHMGHSTLGGVRGGRSRKRRPRVTGAEASGKGDTCCLEKSKKASVGSTDSGYTSEKEDAAEADRGAEECERAEEPDYIKDLAAIEADSLEMALDAVEELPTTDKQRQVGPRIKGWVVETTRIHSFFLNEQVPLQEKVVGILKLEPMLRECVWQLLGQLQYTTAGVLQCKGISEAGLFETLQEGILRHCIGEKLVAIESIKTGDEEGPSERGLQNLQDLSCAAEECLHEWLLRELPDDDVTVQLLRRRFDKILHDICPTNPRRYATKRRLEDAAGENNEAYKQRRMLQQQLHDCFTFGVQMSFPELSEQELTRIFAKHKSNPHKGTDDASTMRHQRAIVADCLAVTPQ